LELDSGNKDAWDQKGNSLLSLHRYDEAELCYNNVLKIDINYGYAWYNKACIESLRNNKQKSIEYLKNAIELDKYYKKNAKKDEDFKIIRNSKEFKKLINEHEN